MSAMLQKSKSLRATKSYMQETPIFLTIVLGGVLTALFYSVINSIPQLKEVLARYFTGHPLEYASASLFFMGIAILLQRTLNYVAERQASLRVLQELHREEEAHANSGENSFSLEDFVSRIPKKLGLSLLAKRMRQTVEYLQDRHSSQKRENGLNDYLKHHGELELSQLYRGYGLYQTIVWAVPILGFLGTVIGITLAIANITPEQLSSSLPEVTSGLAVAFDTTAQALALSLILVFSKMLLFSKEEKHLAEIEQFSIDHLCSLQEKESGLSWNELQHETGHELAQATRSIITEHVNAWEQAASGIRTQFESLGQNQANHVLRALQAGLAETLNTHKEEIEESRKQWGKDLATVVQTISNEIQQNARSQIEQSRLVSESILQAQAKIVQQQNRGIDELNEQVAYLREVIAQQTDVVASQSQVFEKTSSQLEAMKAPEAELQQLQKQLADNLQLIQTTSNFEQTLETLNAAVHMLSARSRPNAA